MLIRKQKTWGSRLLMAMALVSVASVSLAFTEDDTKEPKGDAWPLNTCVVSGGELGSMGDPIVFNHEGREVRFCCKGCIGKFKKDPDKYLKTADAEIIKQQLPHYPFVTCIVMDDEPLGSEDMGEPVNRVYKNRLVRFCCKGCVRKFKKDPAAYIAKLDAAVIKKQMADYPMGYCVVAPDFKLDDDAVNYVFANRLVRLGSKECIKKFNENPSAYLAKIDVAADKKD